jgi:hypothetical protein
VDNLALSNMSSTTLRRAAPAAMEVNLGERGGPQVHHRAHKARLYPAPAQLQKLDRQGHTARALWNLLHEWHGWGGRGGSIAKRPPPREMDRQLRDARSHPLPGWEWLGQLPAQASQQVLRQYLGAWDRYYKGLSGPPRFKPRTTRLAVDLPQAADLRVIRANRRWGEVTVLLVGRARFRWTRSPAGHDRRPAGPNHRRQAAQGSARLAYLLPHPGAGRRRRST